MNFSDISKQVGKFTKANSPAILTAMGIAGAVTAAYLTGKASIKAYELVQVEEARQNLQEDEHLTPREIVATTWKCYIPAATTMAASIVSIIAANRISSRRVASFATALAIGEKAFSEYKEKVVERLGENKERTFRDEIAQDHVNANPPQDRLILVTDGGHVLCRDEYSGRYFKSSMEEIRKAVNDINYRILHDGDASLTEFYDLLGLPKTSHSDDLGWSADDGFDVQFSAALTTQTAGFESEAKPCICFTFDVAPRPTFYKRA